MHALEALQVQDGTVVQENSPTSEGPLDEEAAMNPNLEMRDRAGWEETRRRLQLTVCNSRA